MIWVGVLLAIFALGQFIMAPVIGAFSDHYGRKKVLTGTLWSSFIFNAFSAVGIWTHSITILFISRLLAGAASGNLPIAQASIADMSTEASKGKKMSLVGVIGGISWIIGPPIGGKLADPNIISWFDYATPMWMTALSFMANALLLQWKFRETYVKDSKEKHGLKEELKNINRAFHIRKLRIPLLIQLTFITGWFFFLLFYPTLLVERFQYTSSEIGNLSAYLSIWFLLGSLAVTYWLSHKFKPQELMFLPMVISGIFVIVASTFHHWYYFLISFPFAAMGSSINWVSCMALISNLASQRDQGKIFGVQQSLQSVALFIAPLVSGFISAGHEVLPLLVGGILMLYASFWYYFSFWKRRAILMNE